MASFYAVVQSSNIHRIWWVESKDTMVVEFLSGSTYSYSPITRGQVADLLASPSIGLAFQYLILKLSKPGVKIKPLPPGVPQ